MQRKRLWFGWACLTVLLAGGCVTTTTQNGRQIPNEPSELSQQLDSVKDSWNGFVETLTPNNIAEPIVWEWAAGIPQGALKSESLPAHVPLDAVSAFAPQANLSGLRLVSGAPTAPIALSVVNDTRTRTLADLNSALEAVAGTAADQQPVVEFAGGPPGTTSVPARIPRDRLIALAHTSVPDKSPVRVVEHGNPWLLVKDDAIRCKVMLRKERNTNLIHVVMSMQVCWGPDRKLPVDVRVHCDGQPLSCLGVAEVLGRLYGDEESPRDNSPNVSYAEVAERDEYLIPVNYRALESRLAADQRLARVRPTPAFAVVGGNAYPGPPVLGDARALSGFMLQPRVYAADESEDVGWIVFDGSAHGERENFEVLVDLGSGPQRLVFRIPNVTL